MLKKVSIGLAGTLFLAACGTPGIGLGERDRYVATTPPRYSENKVFALKGTKTDDAELIPFHRQFDDKDDKTITPIKHGEPLTIIVNSVALPPEPKSRDKTYDIAVLLDVATSGSGSMSSLVVWYQTGVRPGQELNFSNLLVYYEPIWDSRIAPLFRMRVVDVADERNKLTRDFLDEAGKVAGGIAAIIPNPAVLPGVSIAFKAAQLVLANRNNEVLLDYSVQFYSAELLAASNNAGLGGLRRGAFVVAGRPVGMTSDYWAQTLTFDKLRGQIKDSKNAVTEAPFMMTTIAAAESIVPKMVIERSAALQKIFTDAIRYDVEQAAKEVKTLKANVDTLVANERVFRYRTLDSVTDLAAKLGEEPATTAFSNEDVYAMTRTMSKIADRQFSSRQEALDWWNNTGINGRFDAATFKIVPKTP